jgi:hypothetical protein
MFRSCAGAVESRPIGARVPLHAAVWAALLTATLLISTLVTAGPAVAASAPLRCVRAAAPPAQLPLAR